jgi:hypothetical protein
MVEPRLVLGLPVRLLPVAGLTARVRRLVRPALVRPALVRSSLGPPVLVRRELSERVPPVLVRRELSERVPPLLGLAGLLVLALLLPAPPRLPTPPRRGRRRRPSRTQPGGELVVGPSIAPTRSRCQCAPQRSPTTYRRALDAL